MSSSVDLFFTDPSIAKIITEPDVPAAKRPVNLFVHMVSSRQTATTLSKNSDLIYFGEVSSMILVNPVQQPSPVISSRTGAAHCLRSVWRHAETEFLMSRFMRTGTTVTRRERLKTIWTHQGDLASLYPHSREHEIAELRLDLVAALASLTDEQIELCGRMLNQNILEISRETGISPSTLYERLRVIRRRLAGLK